MPDDIDKEQAKRERALKIDEEVKKIEQGVRGENNKDNQKLYDSISAEQYRNEMERLRLKEKMADEARQVDVKKGKYWKKLSDVCKEYTKISGQNNFIQWSTNMMNVLGIVDLISTALYHDQTYSRGIKFVFNKIGNAKFEVFGYFETPSINELGQAIKQTVLTGIDRKLEQIGLLDRNKIEYKVTINDKGQLETEASRNGQPLPDDQKMEVDIGIIAWASQLGYTWDTTEYFLADSQGNKMNQALFDKLSADKDHGLNALFQNTFELDLTPQPSAFPPSPRPY